MKTLWMMVVATVFFAFTSADIAQADESPSQQLRQIIIEFDDFSQLQKLRDSGLDIVAVRQGVDAHIPGSNTQSQYRVEAVANAEQALKLGGDGFTWSEVPGKGPTHKIGSPYDVFHSYDEPKTGVKAKILKMAANYRHLAHVKPYGKSVQKRPLLAVRLTNEKIKGKKPQVLFHATTHAREWASTQMALRLIDYLTTSYGSDARVTDLLDTTEIWIIPVINPDGYQYTFTDERFWRKNLADLDGNGEITIGDGVDLNRNYAGTFGLNNEGSSPDPMSEIYRGPGPLSEPENAALADFMDKQDFLFAVSYHTYGDLILYPWGWQVKTPSLDDAIYEAQSGVDGDAAIFDSIVNKHYNPGVSADLYTTNGAFAGFAYSQKGIPAYTVEITAGWDNTGFYGFAFPDDEAQMQTVFEDNLNYALSLAESAHDPAHPVAPTGLDAQDIYHEPVLSSNGASQMIAVTARKELSLELEYTINGGAPQTASFSEALGETYNDKPGLYYSRYVANVPGQQAGDAITYQINGGANTPAGAYTVESASGNPILIVAAEDYTGVMPNQGGGPNFLAYYTDALDAGGYAYDVWDIDAKGAIPTHAEVLSHYDAVIWYTGDDYWPEVPNGNDTQFQEVLNFREYLNYSDGKLFATGSGLSWFSIEAGQYPDDFYQYYLGAFITQNLGGSVNFNPLPVMGEAGDPMLGGLTFRLDNTGGGDGANNQAFADSFVPTSSILPHFPDVKAASYQFTGSNPADAYSGSTFAHSQTANSAYKRLGGTFTLPAGNPSLKFQASFDIEWNWDFGFVEISESGSGVWTTLPDQNGLNTTFTGWDCYNWVDNNHPFLAHYIGGDCSPTGTTGTWNAFTNKSDGWRQVEVDLTAYAGKDVEIYISYASDSAVQNLLGFLVDDIELSGYPLQDFESGLGSWAASIAPGSTETNNWVLKSGPVFDSGAVLRTPDTVYMGFGFEGIDTAANRNAVMDRVMKHLGQ
jgi:hypothetical protein